METPKQQVTFFMNHLLNMFVTRWSGNSGQMTKISPIRLVVCVYDSGSISEIAPFGELLLGDAMTNNESGGSSAYEKQYKVFNIRKCDLNGEKLWEPMKGILR